MNTELDLPVNLLLACATILGGANIELNAVQGSRNLGMSAGPSFVAYIADPLFVRKVRRAEIPETFATRHHTHELVHCGG